MNLWEVHRWLRTSGDGSAPGGVYAEQTGLSAINGYEPR